jgi:carboxypeptidase C (cathepsin A)
MSDADKEKDNDKNNEQKDAKLKFEDKPPVETKHELTIGKKSLKYAVNTGMMPLKNEETGEIEAQIFFMAYTLDGKKDKSKRPLVFVFNGGPGSASVWLHLGALGPKRVKMQDEGWLPAPPYQLVDNPHTWLDAADLVFVDPVGTGYSRSAKAEYNKKYWSLKGDIESLGEFIRLYLTRFNRWTSPLFLAGESYGTTRAAGLAGHLVDKGIAFNGVVLISNAINFQTLRFGRGNDLPNMLYIPTYAATAWYHKKLPDDLQKKPLKDVLAEVEAWTETEYALALTKGDRLDDKERQTIIDQLSRYTGINPTYIDGTNLRIDIWRFCKELLRDRKRTVGRLDSRFKGRDAIAVTEGPEFDPSMVEIAPPYTAMINHYVRSELGYETDTEYETLSYKTFEGWEAEKGQYTDTSEALRSALAKNAFMKVMVAQGYYDLATPHFAAQYTFTHMDIDPELRDNIQTAHYEAGHMFYLDVKSLTKFRKDVEKFMKFALKS